MPILLAKKNIMEALYMQRATLYGLMAVLLWSTVATAFKLALVAHTPTQLLFNSVAISVVFLWVIVVAQGALGRVGAVLREQWRLILIVALINPTAYYLVLFEAYDRLPAQIAQPINYTWAIMLALLSVPILKQRLVKQDWIAGLLGYLGVVVIASQGGLPWEQKLNYLGLFLAIFSTILWAAYWLINTKLKGDPIVHMTLSFSCALPILAIISFLSDGFYLATDSITSVVWVGLLEMGVSFVLWQQALRLTDSVARISNLIFLAPFLSLVFIHYFLGETIHASTFGGLVLIIVGVWIQQQRPKNTVAPE